MTGKRKRCGLKSYTGQIIFNRFLLCYSNLRNGRIDIFFVYNISNIGKNVYRKSKMIRKFWYTTHFCAWFLELLVVDWKTNKKITIRNDIRLILYVEPYLPYSGFTCMCRSKLLYSFSSGKAAFSTTIREFMSL